MKLDISEEFLLDVIRDCQVAAKKDKVIQTTLTHLGQIQNRVELLKDSIKLSRGATLLSKAFISVKVARNLKARCFYSK